MGMCRIFNCILINLALRGHNQGENMNKIKLDLHTHKQFLGEILSDLEYWKFEYEVRIENGTIIIEIYGVGT